MSLFLPLNRTSEWVYKHDAVYISLYVSSHDFFIQILNSVKCNSEVTLYGNLKLNEPMSGKIQI